jgi:hypothetical protein
MLCSAEVNSLYTLKDERQLHVLRQDKGDIEYTIVLRWLENRIKELEMRDE